MLLVFVGLGLIAGWCVEALSGYLPRFADNPPLQETGNLPMPALWHWFTARHSAYPRWFRLHLALELSNAVVLVYFRLQANSISNLSMLTSGYLFLLLIAVIDFKYRLVLNVMTYPAMVILFFVQVGSGHSIIPMLIGGGVTLGIFMVVALLKPGHLGGGDVKLATIIGMFFGYPYMFWALILGAGSGAVASILLLASGRFQLKSRIPYAPFLCLGAMVSLLYNPLSL